MNVVLWIFYILLAVGGLAKGVRAEVYKRRAEDAEAQLRTRMAEAKKWESRLYIETKELNEQVAQLRRERDAAIADLMLMVSGEYCVDFTYQQRWISTEYYRGLKCMFCKKYKHFNWPLPEDHGETCWNGNCEFEWRGVRDSEAPKGEGGGEGEI